MKKLLRNKIMFLIYELAQKKIDGIDVEQQIEELFEMLHILINEQTFVEIDAIWQEKMSATDKESLLLGLMQFDRDARYILIKNNYL